MLYCSDANDQTEAVLNIKDWCERCKSESPQFQFWNLVLTMELTILSLVRSFQEADFTLYRQSLCELISFSFANNNVNYARWLPIHFRDMMLLGEAHPQLTAEFHSGKCVVHKSNREFSALAIDQAHEQANAVIKGDGGAICVTEDPSALRRWMIADPEVSHLVAKYESASEAKDADENTRHHEQAEHTQNAFFDKVQKIYTVMKDMGNPFMDEAGDIRIFLHSNTLHKTVAKLSLLNPATHMFFSLQSVFCQFCRTLE